MSKKNVEVILLTRAHNYATHFNTYARIALPISSDNRNRRESTGLYLNYLVLLVFWRLQSVKGTFPFCFHHYHHHYHPIMSDDLRKLRKISRRKPNSCEHY